MKLNVLFISILLLLGTSISFAQDDDDIEELIWEEISSEQYNDAVLLESNPRATADRFNELGLEITFDCFEICESFLVEEESGRSLFLPADFDQGILDAVISPAGNAFVVYSSYDGPEFDNYYDHRAEIHVFNVIGDRGLDAIQFSESFYIRDWSISNLAWFNDQNIYIKTYTESRSFDGQSMDFKYYKLEL